MEDFKQELKKQWYAIYPFSDINVRMLYRGVKIGCSCMVTNGMLEKEDITYLVEETIRLLQQAMTKEILEVIL